jgi:hypothetical protein
VQARDVSSFNTARVELLRRLNHGLFGALPQESLTGFTRNLCYFGVDKAFSGFWLAIGHQRVACMQHVTRAVAEHRTSRPRNNPFKPSDKLFVNLAHILIGFESNRQNFGSLYYLKSYSHGQQQYSVYIA